jgi:hypothetical protein
MGKKGPLTVPLIPWRTISGQNNPEESSTPIGGQGQERLIGGIFNGETCPPGGGGMGNRAPLAASLILFHILLASYKLLYMRLGFP